MFMAQGKRCLMALVFASVNKSTVELETWS